MDTIAEKISAHLQGTRSLEELSKDLTQALSEMQTHRSDVSGMLAEIPDFLVAFERENWLAVFSKMDDRLSKAEEDVQNRDLLKELAEELPSLEEELLMNSLTVREAAWSARGPSSHAGVNELLYLMERYLDDPNEESLEILGLKLETEAARFEYQAEAYQNLPEFVALAMEQLLPEYRELLERVSQIAEAEDEDVETLFEDLEQWANSYTLYDLEFLQKRYSRIPTIIPAVNFAMNCQMLFLDELVSEDMVDYAVESAVETLEKGSELFLEEKTLSTLDQHVYDEVFGKLMEEIQSLPELEEAEELKEVGGELCRLAQSFSEIQSKSEDHGGSRLDFKSEAQ